MLALLNPLHLIKRQSHSLPLPPEAKIPTIFHITHHKAGSQWVHAILHTLAYHHLVLPKTGVQQFLQESIQPGKIYPTIYVTYQEFSSVSVPPYHRRFVVIRDLRDTLISAYFSIKFSHPILLPLHVEMRQKLHELDMEQGMMYLLEKWIIRRAMMQWSWLAAGERLYKYEELLEHDEELFDEIFRKVCRLPVSPQQVREAVRMNRFEARTNGRPRGVENVHAHERKGIAGDWRNYFTPKIKQSFKACYGSLLIATGYEKDFNW